MALKQRHYVGRFVTADGRPHAFSVWAWNRGEAAALVWAQGREQLGAAFATALFYGVERRGV
jgi:hypothetical protein